MGGARIVVLTLALPNRPFPADQRLRMPHTVVSVLAEHGTYVFTSQSDGTESSHQHALFWDGLRRALALALRDAIPQHDLIITLTFAVVAFFIFVQGWAGQSHDCGGRDLFTQEEAPTR